MSTKTDQEIMARLLFEKYGKIVLTSDETAQILGASCKTIESDRLEACGIPYTRRNNKERGQVMYSITTIARILVDNEVKTI